ncbi:MAG: serine/threonine protein phosphatase [Clostridia bacterium]|nr:serine/threonine protein phosphatase [Clostridia bacterium]
MAKKKKEAAPSGVQAVAVPQSVGHTHPFTALQGYFPGRQVETELYRSLREAIPLIDASLDKTVRLLGEFTVHCSDDTAQQAVRRFMQDVHVGGMQRGIQAFVRTFFDQLLTYGTAVGEMALTGRRLTHLYNADLRDIALTTGENPLDVTVCTRGTDGKLTPVRYPALILKSVLNPEPGSIYGTSLLKGLPFVSEVLLKIYNTIGVNWERLGNVRYAVTYKPQNDALDKAYAKERAEQVATQWQATMQSGGSVKDFVAVGDVSIRAIGADNQILDSEVPVRQLLEQIVAKLGVPPFLLGLSWSSTERMSTQQADILTSEIDFYRRLLDPTLRTIFRTFLCLEGYDSELQIEWEPLTLQDITALARASYYDAQTKKILTELKGENA